MNIFIARLNYSTTGEDLQRLFEQYGTVDSSKVVLDRDTGRSKGFGFIEMENKEEALNAISNLNETEFMGRNIVVKEARPRD